ncbi:hypothetical protein CAPTEDRAFT_212320 [Capitella teleta]|uniref:Alpha-1,4-N-acetylglucosaminyltransferase n=1 Tax=Capitella teleta TaxID=283909 RepID=R7TER7_CAPTE|nr:hypothetical protein CAPTEDRAFT_212320 [Capitella teleta]|eukprot:ELT89561.1 hypothetical protein CAPTEDRAFT_212320 [Capitella teleta]
MEETKAFVNGVNGRRAGQMSRLCNNMHRDQQLSLTLTCTVNYIMAIRIVKPKTSKNDFSSEFGFKWWLVHVLSVDHCSLLEVVSLGNSCSGSRSDACGKQIMRLLAFGVCCAVLVVLVNSAIHASDGGPVYAVLNQVAVSKPTTCDPDTDFRIDPSRAPPASSDALPVPNIVHYIWYHNKPVKLKFFHMLSMLSAEKYLKPDIIYFHTDFEPVGEYWEQAKRNLTKLQVVHRKPTTCLFGEPIKNPVWGTSQSNVDRLVVLMEYGGIYLDLDVLIVQSFDPLRKYPCTLGLESPVKICGSIIISAPDSVFVKLWVEHFIFDYQIWTWAYNTGRVPTDLARRYPNLVHMEEDRLEKPNGDEIEKIWGNEHFDWRHNYAVHLLWRTWKSHNLFIVEEPDFNFIKTDNSSFSQMARRILYQ